MIFKHHIWTVFVLFLLFNKVATLRSSNHLRYNSVQASNIFPDNLGHDSIYLTMSQTHENVDTDSSNLLTNNQLHDNVGQTVSDTAPLQTTNENHSISIVSTQSSQQRLLLSPESY